MGLFATNVRNMPKMLDNVSAAHRPPRQVKPGTAPGRGARPGAGADGQPPFVPTDEQRTRVRRLVACGFSNDSIAVVTGIPVNTLERHFAFQLQHGKVISDATILTGIVTQAEEGDKTMQIFWAKARARWRDVGKDADANDGGNTVFAINISHGGGQIDPPTIEGESHRIVVHTLPEPEKEP